MTGRGDHVSGDLSHMTGVHDHMTGRGDHVSGDLSHMTGVHGKYKGLLHAWKKEDHLKHSWKENN